MKWKCNDCIPGCSIEFPVAGSVPGFCPFDGDNSDWHKVSAKKAVKKKPTRKTTVQKDEKTDVSRLLVRF